MPTKPQQKKLTTSLSISLSQENSYPTWRIDWVVIEKQLQKATRNKYTDFYLVNVIKIAIQKAILTRAQLPAPFGVLYTQFGKLKFKRPKIKGHKILEHDGIAVL